MRQYITPLVCCAAMVLGTATLSAQTLKVRQGSVTTLVPAADAGDMLVNDGGTTLTIAGQTYPVPSLTDITIDDTPVTANTVGVTWAAGAVQVTVSADVAPYLMISVENSNVSVVAAPDLQQEVTYTLSGTSSAGSFYMDGEYKAGIVLDGLTLTNPSGPAIQIDNGKRIDVVLPDGTTSTLVDGAGGTHKACLFINGHAEWKGGGTLNLTGNTRHAYASDEYTQFKSSFGRLNILSAATDGLHIEQYLQMDGGTIDVKGAKGDCIDVGKTKDPTDELNGQALINAGTLNLAVTADDTKGLKTDSLLIFSGGTLTAEVSGLGSKGISAGGNLTIQQKTATPTLIKMNVTGTTYMPGNEELEAKCRGIKAKADFTFDGGTINMTVTGKKAKGISVDGNYIYRSGTTNVLPE